MMPRQLLISPLLPTPHGIKVQTATTDLLEIVDMEKQLVEKKDKLKQFQEENIDSLQQINQLLHDELNDYRWCEQLQLHNTTLKAQIEDQQRDHHNLQLEIKERIIVKLMMVEKASSTYTTKILSLDCALTEKLSKLPRSLSPKICNKLWELENKITLTRPTVL